jgi:transcription antitermination factor NusG
MADWLIAICMRTEAYERLCDSGQTCYRPMYRVRQRRGYGRPIYVPKPLLSACILIELVIAEWAEQFHRIVAVRGVGGVLTREEKPMVAREHEVQRIRDSEVRGFEPKPQAIRFVRDQQVQVSRSPFQGQLAVFKREKGVLDVVELTLFGSSRELVLPMGSLVAA